MNNASFIIYNARLVDRDTDCAGSIYVKNGKIEAVYKTSSIEKVQEAIASTSKKLKLKHQHKLMQRVRQSSPLL